MKTAVTSQNFRSITGHAGKTRRFLIYEVDAGTDPVEIERLDLPKEMSMHEFRGDTHPLFDCDILITGSAGTGFVNRLAKHQVLVITTSATDPLQAVRDIAAGKALPGPDHTH